MYLSPFKLPFFLQCLYQADLNNISWSISFKFLSVSSFQEVLSLALQWPFHSAPEQCSRTTCMLTRKFPYLFVQIRHWGQDFDWTQLFCEAFVSEGCTVSLSERKVVVCPFQGKAEPCFVLKITSRSYSNPRSTGELDSAPTFFWSHCSFHLPAPWGHWVPAPVRLERYSCICLSVVLSGKKRPRCQFLLHSLFCI